MGHTRRPTPYVNRLEDHQTRVQGDFTKQKNHSHRSR